MIIRGHILITEDKPPQFICEVCQCLLFDEDDFFRCSDCQLQGEIENLENWISEIAEFVALGGDFLMAEAERVKAVNELNKLLEDNKL